MPERLFQNQLPSKEQQQKQGEQLLKKQQGKLKSVDLYLDQLQLRPSLEEDYSVHQELSQQQPSLKKEKNLRR